MIQSHKKIFGILVRKEGMRPTTLIILVSLFFVFFCNIAFFRNVLAVFPVSPENIVFLLSLVVGITALLTFLLTLITSKYTIKQVLIFLLSVTSLSAYFMDNYNVIIDDEMIRNILATDWAETSDLLSWKMVWYFLFLGVLPGLLVYRVKLRFQPLKKAILYKTVTCILSFLVLVVMISSSGKHYVSFFREHKPLRYYTNPSYYLYAVVEYAASALSSPKKDIVALGEDARVVNDSSGEKSRPKLIILVVGEAARADHFSLNGYERETNPLLEKEDILNFSEMYSCGTSTAYSVPCMFSHLDRHDYSPRKGRLYENILDVLNRTNAVDVLWRDNNSDSKGVALRVRYEDFKTPENNPICDDGECRDEGMLYGLDQYVTSHKGDDLLIVLHQKGNHGPAYYKRYPKEFERFQPVCKTNQLEECTREEITNAYDNALLYTDYFLSKVISFLKGYEMSHDTAMLYFSDHGESLGENNIYLHGLPYLLAPDSQTHIGSLMWFGGGMKEMLDLQRMRRTKDMPYSHDNIFHTLLGIFNVETELYSKNLDLVSAPVETKPLLSKNTKPMK